MADISKFSPDAGTSEYNVKDATARSDIASIVEKIPSNASSGNKMVTASDIATKADLVDGKVPAAQLPSFVDDVLEYASTSAFPATGESGKIYVALDTNKTYRWGGSDYVEISESLALGETSSTAYAGDKGKANADAISDIQDLIPSTATSSNKLATASDIPTVPTALADLIDDSTHRVVTDTEKTTWSSKQDALTFDNAPTANSNNPVKSGGIKTELDAKMSYADNGVLGAKNLLSLKSASKNPSTTLTVVFNNNGSITLNGTQESAASLVVLSARGDANATRLKGDKDYILSIENPSMYVYMQVGYTSPGDSSFVLVAQSDYGESELNFRCPLEADNQPWTMQILCRSGFNPSNYTIYPMLRFASDPDDTYAPYAMTNRELTDELTVKESAVTNIVEGATVDKNFIYKSGHVVTIHFFLKNATCDAWGSLGTIPNGYRPKQNMMVCGVNQSTSQPMIMVIGADGIIKPGIALTDKQFAVHFTWITS